LSVAGRNTLSNLTVTWQGLTFSKLKRILKTIASRSAASQTRNPERTQERILLAAFKEFAAKGFAGARVDCIARRAAINKRMLYHYFGDKEALFREVLRRKIEQRQAWGVATPDDPRESLPYWFDLACKDKDWIRLLEWEALQFGEGRLIDEERRIEAARLAVQRILRRQSLGHLSADLDSRNMLLAMLALTWFPVAFPQLTRLITGRTAADPRFIRGHQTFLRHLATAFSNGDGFKASRVNGRTKNVCS
jgi:TetR/AcrR family transcriptional regulator